MKNFIKKLFSSSDEVSSKRFISLWSLFLFTGMVVGSFYGIPFSSELIWAAVSLCAGASGLTLLKNQP
jgi:hypothetical protein